MARRVHNRRSSLAVASAALLMLAACSGTLPGLGSEAEPTEVRRQSAPGVTTRTVLQEGYGRRTATVRPPEAGSGGGESAAGVPASTTPYGSAPPSPAVQSPVAAPVMTANEIRDRQLDMLTEAVAALRQEVAKSYEHSQRLTQENEKLRGVVASLRSELARGKGANKVLKDHLQALEKRMRELRPPPLEPSGKAEAPAADDGGGDGSPPSADGGLDTGPSSGAD